MTLTSADDLIALLLPGRWHGPAGVRPPSLKQCLTLALLLHVLAVLVLGNAPGGSARQGEGVYGALNITLSGNDPGRGDPATVASDAYTGPQGTATQRRWGGTVRADSDTPTPADAPGAARLGTWQSMPVPAEDAGDAPGQAQAPVPAPDMAMTAPGPAPAVADDPVQRAPFSPTPVTRSSVHAPAAPLATTPSALPMPPVVAAPQPPAPAPAPAAPMERVAEPVPARAPALPPPAIAQRDTPLLTAAAGPALPAPPAVTVPAPAPAEALPVRAPVPRPSLPRSQVSMAAAPMLAAASAPALPPAPVVVAAPAPTPAVAPVSPPTAAAVPQPVEAPAPPARKPVAPAVVPPSAVRTVPMPPVASAAELTLPAPPMVQAAPAAVPASPMTPASLATPVAAEVAAAPAATSATSRPASVQALPASSTATAMGPAAERSGALSDPGSRRASAGAPDAGARLGHDVATPPALPSSAPRLNLELVRPRGGELSRRGSTGVLPLLPRPPETPAPKSKLAEEIDKAARPDCRTAYASMGLAAAAPLVRDAIQGDGCRW